MYENLAGEYSNLELHPEVTPGLLLPTFYTVSSTISRHALTNRPPIPTIEELDDIIIGDSYRKYLSVKSLTTNRMGPIGMGRNAGPKWDGPN